jgi:hypothetical protein
MACTAVRVGCTIAIEGRLLARCHTGRRLERLRIAAQLSVLAAIQSCHRRRAKPTFVAIRSYRSPAQLQRQQYQQENKQSGSHPENCKASLLWRAKRRRQLIEPCAKQSVVVRCAC